MYTSLNIRLQLQPSSLSYIQFVKLFCFFNVTQLVTDLKTQAFN